MSWVPFDLSIVTVKQSFIVSLNVGCAVTAMKSLFLAATCAPGLSMRHDWPVKSNIVYWLIKMKVNLKHTSGNSLSPMGPRTRILACFADVTNWG